MPAHRARAFPYKYDGCGDQEVVWRICAFLYMQNLSVRCASLHEAWLDEDNTFAVSNKRMRETVPQLEVEECL